MWQSEWAFAYSDQDYPDFTINIKNNNSVPISVEDLIEGIGPIEFDSFSAAERYFE